LLMYVGCILNYTCFGT